MTEQIRDGNQLLEMEYKVTQDALKYRLNKAQNELVLKTNEDMLHEAGIQAEVPGAATSFAVLGPVIAERGQ
jgi:hypothetical protein